MRINGSCDLGRFQGVRPRSTRPAWLSRKRTVAGREQPHAAVMCSSDSASDSSSPAGRASFPLHLSRRALLQGLSVGSAYAWAGRAHAAEPPTLEAQLSQRVSEFTLDNGLRFIISERRVAPTVSCHTYADVGAWEEEESFTGIAHLLEHMAFKGTPRIGTKDYRKEAPLLEAMDEVFYEMRGAGSGREAARLSAQLSALQAQAAELSVPNAYGALLQRQGAVGLNAATSHDATKYYVSLPANKLELWFALESERFQVPVFRELYSEKAVVSEERRLRVDNAPLGPFQEAFALASLTNNYRRPVIGFQEDIDRIGRREVQDFFSRHYCPTRLVIAIAGDVRPEQVRQLAEKYFGGWRPSAPPAPSTAPLAREASSVSAGASAAAAAAAAATIGGAATAETLPRSSGGSSSSSNGFSSGGSGGTWPGEAEPLPAPAAGAQRDLRRKARAGPAVMQAYYRPSVRSEDSLELEMVSDTLSGSRSSRLYKSLVLGGRALSATAISSYPGEKHPGQFVLYGIPSKGVSMEALDAELAAQAAAMAGEGPSPAELRRYKKSARASLLDALVSNATLASALASYQVLSGDWRQVLVDLDRIEGMQGEQVRAAAERLFRSENCFKGYVLPE